MEIMYFKLKKGVGTHSGIDPETGERVIYEADGTVIPSKSDLALKFPEKFVKVDVNGISDSVEDSALIEERAKQLAKVEIKKAEEAVAAAEQRAKDAEATLAAMKKVVASKEAKDDKPAEPADESDVAETDDADEKVSDFGEDVTEKFKNAKENDFTVFYGGPKKGHFVTETDNPGVALNKDKLNKGDVEGFIKEYLTKA
jgi:hypothetical protein